MVWKTLIEEKKVVSIPYVGRRKIFYDNRSFEIDGDTPQEHGWNQFEMTGRKKIVWTGCVGEMPPTLEEDCKRRGISFQEGYLVDGRFVSLSKIQKDTWSKCRFAQALQWRKEPLEQAFQNNPFFQLSTPLALYDETLERFTRIRVVRYEGQFDLYAGLAFPTGAEMDVMDRFFAEGALSEGLEGVKGVAPDLAFAFAFESYLRHRREEQRRRQQERLEQERIRREEEARRLEQEALLQARRAEILRQIGTGAGRREMARVDFESAARAALEVSGATLLDWRRGHQEDERVIQFRFQERRFECVVDLNLHVTDAGICLDGHDDLFTLESLPPVIAEAIRRGVLHVYRRV